MLIHIGEAIIFLLFDLQIMLLATCCDVSGDCSKGGVMQPNGEEHLAQNMLRHSEYCLGDRIEFQRGQKDSGDTTKSSL